MSGSVIIFFETGSEPTVDTSVIEVVLGDPTLRRYTVETLDLTTVLGDPRQVELRRVGLHDLLLTLGAPAVPPGWGSYENALRQWVIQALGFDTTRVIRAEQDGPRPPVPFAEVRIGGLIALGAADQVDSVFDPTAEAGEEIAQTVRGQREVSVTVRVFTTSAVGNNSARAKLSRAQTYLGLPSVRAALTAAGITCFDQGAIQNLPAILDTKWEGRATLTIRCYVVETVTETSTYIATADVGGEVSAT